MRIEKILFAAAIIFFLVVQLWMSWFLWQRRGNIPPAFDDSYFYITKIDLIVTHGSLLPDLPGLSQGQILDFALQNATYTVTFGGAARLLGVDASTIYYWSFFIGKVVLLLALLFFLARLGLSLLEQAASMVVLAPFSGEAAIHGFFWVVPSFWLFILFLVIVGFLIRPPVRLRGYLLGLLLSVLFFFLHPLSLWAALVLFLFFILITTLDKESKKILPGRLPFVVGFVIGVVLSELLVVLLPSLRNEQQTIQSIVVQLSDQITDRSFIALSDSASPFLRGVLEKVPGLWIMWRSYLRFILLPPVAILLVWTAWKLWCQNRRLLTMLFVTTLLGVLATAIHPFGYRTVEFIWPTTLIMLTIGILHGPNWLTPYLPLLKRFVLPLRISAITLLSGALMAHSFTFVRAYRNSDDVSWDTSCAQYLLEVADDQDIIEYSDKYSVSAFLAHGLLERRRSVVQEYMMKRQQSPNFSGQYFYVESPRAVVTRSDVEQILGEELALLRQCGFFSLYALEKHTP